MTFVGPGSGPAKPPGRIWYGVAVLVLVLGFVATGIFVAVEIPKLGGRLTQVVVPGEANLRLNETGTYTIFHERSSVVDGRVYAGGSLSGMRVSLRNPRGERVSLASAPMSSTYDFNGRSGVAVFNFEVAEPGSYRLTAGYDDGRTSPRTVLAVGRGFVGALLSTVFGALGIAFGGMAIAAFIAVRAFIKRRRVRRGPPPLGTPRQPTVS